MIDLETDDGMREAFRSIADWDVPPAEVTDGGGRVTLVPLTPRVAPRRRHPVLLVGAAALMVVVVGAALLFRAPTEPTPAASGSWAPMATAPLEARFDPVTLWTGTELLVWGGHDEHGEEYVDGAAYNPDRDRWRRIADFPFEYERRTGVSVGQNGFHNRFSIPGTWFGGEAVFVVATAELRGWDLVAYDPEVDAWRIVDRLRFDHAPGDRPVTRDGTAPVQAPTALAAVNGKLFAFGWNVGLSELGWSVFDPTTTRWSGFTGIPGSGELHGFNGVRSEPLVVAGHHLVWLREHGTVGDGLPHGYAVDLASGRIITIEVPVGLPPGTIDLQGGDLSTSGVLVGEILEEDLHLRPYAASLDPATGRWTVLEPPRSGTAEDDDGGLVDADGFTFLIGGLDRTGRSSTRSASLVMSDHRTGWQALTPAPIDLSRTGHVMTWTGDELLVWGGATDADENAPRATVPLSDGARYRFSNEP